MPLARRRRIFLLLSLSFSMLCVASAYSYAYAQGSLTLPDVNVTPVTILGYTLPCTNGWDCTLCAGTGLVQAVINFCIMVAFPLAAVLFAWAGALFMTSAANPAGIERAKSIFRTVGTGFLFVLFGYLIIDTIIHAVIINNNSPYFPNATWNTVGACVDRLGMTNQPITALLGGNFAPAPTVGLATAPDSCSSGMFSNGACNNNGTYSLASGYACPDGSSLDAASGNCMQCTVGGCDSVGPPSVGGIPGTISQQAPADCSTSALASVWGSNASTMSCVLGRESGCNAAALSSSDVGADGNPVSVGLYQLNLTGATLSQPACTSYNNGQALNCSTAFNAPFTGSASKSVVRVTNQALYDTCVKAAQDPSCNTATAQALSQMYANAGKNPLGAWNSDSKQCGI